MNFRLDPRQGIILLLIITVMIAGCTSDQQTPAQPTDLPSEESYATGFDTGALESSLETYPTGTLSAIEASDILYLQEEEKLARDVYAVFYETWKLQVFINIGNAEQTHMDSVTVLVDRYGLEPSAADRASGEFANPELQSLYDQLVADGARSSKDALRAAALVEETDIADLRDAISRTDNEDIRYVYENLMRGSENHLRAFVRNLEQQGESYTPMVLSDDEYEGIVSTPVRPGGLS